MRVREQTKKVVKKYLKNKPKPKKAKSTRGRKTLYTDSERKEIRSLQQKLYRRRNKLSNLAHDNQYTMEDIRPLMSVEMGNELFYGGYFEDNQYDSKDFREWMLENKDDEMLKRLLDEINGNLNDDTQISNDPSKEPEHITDLKKEIEDLETKIKEIQSKAKDRRDLNELKELAKELTGNSKEKGMSLADMIDAGDLAIDLLTDPKRTILLRAKQKIAQTVIKEFKNELNSDAKEAIRAGIINNPVSGIRQLISSVVNTKLTERYGNSIADAATPVVDLLTGKGRKSSVYVGFFNLFVDKSPANKQLMIEKASDLIESGQSDERTEKLKMLGRDVIVTAVTETLKSGGNLYAAIPKTLGKVFFGFLSSSVSEKKEPEKKETFNKEKADQAREKYKNMTQEQFEAEMAKFLQ